MDNIVVKKENGVSTLSFEGETSFKIELGYKTFLDRLKVTAKVDVDEAIDSIEEERKKIQKSIERIGFNENDNYLLLDKVIERFRDEKINQKKMLLKSMIEHIEKELIDRTVHSHYTLVCEGLKDSPKHLSQYILMVEDNRFYKECDIGSKEKTDSIIKKIAGLMIRIPTKESANLFYEREERIIFSYFGVRKNVHFEVNGSKYIIGIGEARYPFNDGKGIHEAFLLEAEEIEKKARIKLLLGQVKFKRIKRYLRGLNEGDWGLFLDYGKKHLDLFKIENQLWREMSVIGREQIFNFFATDRAEIHKKLDEKAFILASRCFVINSKQKTVKQVPSIDSYTMISLSRLNEEKNTVKEVLKKK